MKRKLNYVVSAILVFMVGCGSDSNSISISNNDPILVQSIPLAANALNGSNNIVVASYTDSLNAGANTGYKETLKIYQQDPVNADLLLDLSSVYLGVDTLYHRVSDITLNSQWAAITMNDNELYTNLGWVALVSLSGPNYTLSATLEINATLDRAVAVADWLLVASNTDLALYSISTPTSPVLKGSYSLSTGTTSLAALAKGFFVITNNGYAYIDVTDPLNILFSESASADIKQSKKSYLIGNKLYIGGPSKYAGKVKIARLDLSIPGSPAIDIINDLIDGTFIDFSFDGVDGYYLRMDDSVKLYKESGSSLVLITSASLGSYPNNASQFYAYNGRFYTGKSSVNIYKMP